MLKKKGAGLFVHQGLDRGDLTQVPFLLTNPVSDLVNPDCLNVRVSWNENRKKDRGIKTRGPITFFKTKMAGFRRAPFAFFSLLEELLRDPCEIAHDKKDDFFTFMVLEEHKNNCQNAEIRTDAFVERTVLRMSYSSIRHTSDVKNNDLKGTKI